MTQPAGGTVTTKNPNDVLRRIRSSVATLNRSNPSAIAPDVHDLVKAIQDLDNHLSWGGIPPDDWASAPFAASAMRDRDAFGGGPHPVEDLIRRM